MLLLFTNCDLLFKSKSFLGPIIDGKELVTVIAVVFRRLILDDIKSSLFAPLSYLRFLALLSIFFIAWSDLLEMRNQSAYLFFTWFSYIRSDIDIYNSIIRLATLSKDHR